MEMTYNSSEEKIFEWLKERAIAQSEIETLEEAIQAREKENRIKQFKEIIIKKGKAFGQSAKKIEENYLKEKQERESLLQKYEKALQRFDNMYNNFKQKGSAAKALVEKEEVRLTGEIAQLYEENRARRQREEAINKEIYECSDKIELKPKMNEFMQLMEMNKKAQKQMEDDFKRLEKVQKLYEELNKYIERENKRYEDLAVQLFEKKEEKLAEIKKQSTFQKILGKFFNKVSGAKRFSKRVIDDISHRIDVFLENNLTEMENENGTIVESVMQQIPDDKDTLKSVKDSGIDDITRRKDEKMKIIRVFEERIKKLKAKLSKPVRKEEIITIDYGEFEDKIK